MKILSIHQFILVFLCFFSVDAKANSGLVTDFTGEIVSTYRKVYNTIWPEFDFWKSTTELGDRLKQTVEDQLREKSDEYKVAAEKIKEFKEAMHSVVDSVEVLRKDITARHLAARGEHDVRDLNLEDFKSMFLARTELVLDDLKAEFSEPLPEDQEERLVGVWDITEVDAREKFGQVKPHLQRALNIIGKLIDNHPVLFEIIMSTVVTLIIPESWFLRPLLRAFGFGPLGPIKGSMAAWAQRFFWGGNVAEGSWFAICQRAAMNLTNCPFWKILM